MLQNLPVGTFYFTNSKHYASELVSRFGPGINTYFPVGCFFFCFFFFFYFVKFLPFFVLVLFQ